MDIKKHTGTRHDIKAQSGASLVEFTIAAPLIFLLGAGTLQAGILYHGRTILNYATFEAARVGATRHAQHKPMRKELGIRLAPLIGGDGTLENAAIAMAKMSVEVESPIGLTGQIAPPTRLEILNPTEEAFSDDNWGEYSLEYANRRVIPNSHLRYQGDEVKGGLSLQDANLLKIEVTHGIPLNVPVVGRLLAKLMVPVFADDVDKQMHLLSGRFPMTSTATVRMQSEAWEEAIVEARAKPYGEVISGIAQISQALLPDNEGEGGPDSFVECDDHGLPLTVDLAVETHPDDTCPVPVSTGLAPTIEAPVESSPITGTSTC